MTAYQNRAARDLAPHHRRTLEVGSAISPAVIAERGVYSITKGRELPKGFSKRQKARAPGILFQLHRPNGETAWCYRPDAPDPESPGRKYEMPCKAYGGPGNVLDVHPSQRHLIADKRVPVVFVEGVKKGAAIATAARAAGVEVLVVVIVGVWNWLSDHKPIADMLSLPLKGREVWICFDSDVFRNPDVAAAARRLNIYAVERGAAAVKIAYLPDQADGSKTGADDYLAAGHTYAELAQTFKPFDPEDLAAERLMRGDMLRAMLEDLRRSFWSAEFKGMGGHSARDVFKVLVDLAPDRGKLHEDGLRVKVSRRELARLAKVSSRTLQKAIVRLEEDMGLIYRDTERRKVEERGAFVLRASVKHYEESRPDTGSSQTPTDTFHPGVLHLRAPRLRWSSPARKRRRGVVQDTRRVRLSIATSFRPAIKRLGKVRGAILDALDAAGGSATLVEICEVLQRKRLRDLVRFKASEKGHDGPVVMLLEAGIVKWVSDVQTRREVLRLAPDWLQRLEEARKVGREVDSEEFGKGADTLDRERHKREGEAFRRRLKVVPDTAPTEEEMRERREARPAERQDAIRVAIGCLFAERPEYRGRRAGQIVCQLPRYLAADFPLGEIGLPKDAEVEEILAGAAA